MAKSRKLLFTLATGLTVLMLAGTALAAGYWYNYNLNVPGFGGTVVTANKSKVSYNNPRVSSQLVGGNYGMYVRMEFGASSYPVTNYGWINDYYNITLPLTVSLPGLEPMHDRFKSAITQPVTVNVIGRWSPDNPAW